MPAHLTSSQTSSIHYDRRDVDSIRAAESLLGASTMSYISSGKLVRGANVGFTKSGKRDDVSMLSNLGISRQDSRILLNELEPLDPHRHSSFDRSSVWEPRGWDLRTYKDPFPGGFPGAPAKRTLSPRPADIAAMTRSAMQFDDEPAATGDAEALEPGSPPPQRGPSWDSRLYPNPSHSPSARERATTAVRSSRSMPLLPALGGGTWRPATSATEAPALSVEVPPPLAAAASLPEPPCCCSMAALPSQTS